MPQALSHALPFAPPAETNAAPAALSHTVEGELLGMRPRAVVWTKATALIRRIWWNALIGAVLLFFATLQSHQLPPVALLVVAPLVYFLGTIVYAQEKDLRRQMRLLCFGVPTTGRVVSGEVKTSENVVGYYFNYLFDTRDGTTVAGQFPVSPGRYEALGSEEMLHTVLYDEANPRNNALYSQLIAAQVLGK